MTTYALISHTRGDDILAWRYGEIVTVRQYLGDVKQLAASLPPGKHMLNACSDRYHFAVGLGAALLTQKISLLPPTHTPEMMRQLRTLAPDVFCLADAPHAIELPGFAYQDAFAHGPSHTDPEAPCDIPLLPGEQAVADVFTSGSTGQPLPHRKTWGSLVRSARGEALRLGLDEAAPCTVVGTVPPQHMFGFESTVLLPMQSGGALHAGQPFYPADIVSAVKSVTRPRMLVSTPVHLRVLLASNIELPALDLVVSATAPMAPQLAQSCEARFEAPLFEIYGSTETGQIASRRTAQTAEWELFPLVTLTPHDERMWACGGHVEQVVPLNDVLQAIDNRHFLLHGRLEDLVNIAGKRNSLAYLNHHLNSIPGVLDGAFFMPDDSGHETVVRLVAFVVAPDMTAAAVQAALKERIDSIFLPRPLVLLDALPRNATGKLPRDVLEALARFHQSPAAQEGPPRAE
ncbi:MAG: AMP-binding protein [Polaromonas sp.]|uniref:AMP-binding protein n=1 Tax=Polaromonas sp. TaxID=1869339 RepID=UPI00271EB683|nr:AMP-binding protein [Polaromonas sp.]MDO9112642.1 AMP-binding protein [Polaromonas sp.]MDP2450782.1 AMP-binding protein [Polaromonas sp.]MDP3247720.1 AMP-binding protein [Polaromonas sp.]